MDAADNRFYRERSDGGRAFPWCGDLNETPSINLGMSLRDYFAAKAMAGMLGGDHDWAHLMNHEQLALRAYGIANAMISSRGVNISDNVGAEQMRAALEQIANGATGYLDRDTDLANIAKRALGMEVD